MFSLGNAFLIPDSDPDRVPHVWVIISDPDISHDQIVLVPMSSFEDYKDCSCRIDKGEHPNAAHESVIEYRFAMVTSAETLHNKVKAHVVRPRADFSKDLLDRIHEGAENSQFIPSECYTILHGQGLLPCTRTEKDSN